MNLHKLLLFSFDFGGHLWPVRPILRDKSSCKGENVASSRSGSKPCLETSVEDIHFQQNGCRAIKITCLTRVLHFKVYNTSLKGKKWNEKVQKNAKFSFWVRREAFHQEIVLQEIQPCFLHGGAHGLFWNATKAAKFLLNFQVHFTLYGQENYVFQGELTCLLMFYSGAPRARRAEHHG